jgi:hypothetical protein
MAWWWRRSGAAGQNILGTRPPDPSREDETGLIDRYKLLLRVQIALAIGCLFVFVYAYQFRGTGAAWRVSAIGILISGAALFAGFVSGFVFGIPRTPKPVSSPNPANPISGKAALPEGASGAVVDKAREVESNSNLVEISDWLTKILVGVGLVELNQIPHRLHDLAVFLGPGLRAHSRGPGIQASQDVAISIVLFFFGAGFLFGYLWTRLYFEKALEQLAKEPARRDDAWELATTAQDLMDSGRLNDALRTVNDALNVNPQNAKALAVKGRILKRMALTAGLPEDRERLLRQALDYAARAAQLMPNRAAPIYNMACYEALLGMDSKIVLAHLATAVQMNPELKREAPRDKDLTSLWETPDFKAIVQE